MSRSSVIPAPASTPRLRVAARVGAAVLGGYIFTWGFIAAATALLFKAGMAFHDSEFLGTAIGLLIFLAAFLCTIATRRLAMASIVLFVGAGLMAAVGSLVQATIV